MTANERTVGAYMDGFRRGDRAAILACLADDVEWEMPGLFHLRGKAAFDAEIENDAFVGRPDIAVTRLIEAHDVVVAEGRVRAQRKAGGILHAAFCDVFTFENGRIERLVSYVMEVPPDWPNRSDDPGETA
ncbi:MAG TPA: nuclear transport factor 2 family protein [Burkholderiales bacterium]